MTLQEVTKTSGLLAALATAGFIGSEVTDLDYADGAKISVIQERTVPAHKEPLYKDSVIDDSTSILVCYDSIDVPEKTYYPRGNIKPDIWVTPSSEISIPIIVDGEIIAELRPKVTSANFPPRKGWGLRLKVRVDFREDKEINDEETL